ncbi:MAG: ATP-binding cassette domain-containing protein [Planctomycetes bacterium]|nr:ATP-binding cassette domain-containing protein [Planctomycetota bacterium]
MEYPDSPQTARASGSGREAGKGDGFPAAAATNGFAAGEDVHGGFGLRNVYFSYGVHPALRDVTLSVRPGEVHALVGARHSGKSTVGAVMAGLADPDGGQVVAGGTAYPSLSPARARKLRIAHVSARPRIYPRMTVLDNLVSGDKSHWLGLFPKRKNRARVQEWLDRYGIVLPLFETMLDVPRDLWSVVDILSKLFQNPDLLVMDEAIEELSQPSFRRVLDLVRVHVANGMAVLFITHNVGDALNFAGRVSVMRQGRLILTSAASTMERLNLISLCYSQLERQNVHFSSQEKFLELMRYTEAMLRDLPVAILILDTKSTIRFVNGKGREVFPDSTTGGGELFGPGNRRLRELVLASCETGEDTEHHAVPIESGSRKRIANVWVQSIRENGVTVGTMVIVEDVSLREELRQRLILSEQLASIGLLAAGVAHEVNNPLEIIGNYLNYLRDDTANDHTREILSLIDEEVARIHEITNHLVAYTGSKNTREEPVDVMTLARETIALLRYHREYNSFTFTFQEDDPDTPPLVMANPAELRQVFLNLVRNSIDAMPDGGVITVRAGVEANGPAGDGGRRLVIRFRDNGPGLPLDNANDSFLPFVSTKKSAGSHQGLGLYIVYGLVHKFGGGISVENGEAGGCEFILKFPLAEPSATE